MAIILIKRNRGSPNPKSLPLNPTSFLLSYTMIINNFLKNITKYLDLGKEIPTLPLYGCKSCGYEGMLHLLVSCLSSDKSVSTIAMASSAFFVVF